MADTWDGAIGTWDTDPDIWDFFPDPIISGVPQLTAQVGTVTVFIPTVLVSAMPAMTVYGNRTAVGGPGPTTTSAQQVWGSHTQITLIASSNRDFNTYVVATFTQSAAGVTVTPPGIFTQIFTGDVSSGGLIGRFQIFWAQSPTPGAAMIFTHASCNSSAVSTAFDFSSPLFDLPVALSSGTGTTSTAGAINITDNPNQRIMIVAHDWNTGTNLRTPAAGFTEHFDQIVHNQSKSASGLGATGAASFTNGNTLGTDPWQAVMIAPKMAGVDVSIRTTVDVTSPTMTMSVGSVSIATTVNVTGQQLTVSVGDVTQVLLGVRASVTGDPLAASVGNVSVTGKANVTFAAPGMTASVGNATTGIQTPISVNVTGLSMTVSVGDVSISMPRNVFLTGNPMTISVGTASVALPWTVTVTAPGMTAFVGDASVSGKANVSVTGGLLVPLLGIVSISTVNTTLVNVTAMPPMWLVSPAGSGASPTLGWQTSTTWANRANTPVSTVDDPRYNSVFAVTFTQNSPAGVNLTPPAGWTSIYGPTSVNVSSLVGRFQVFWTQTTSRLPPTISFNHVGANTMIALLAYDITESVLDTVGAVSSGTGTTTTAASLSYADPNERLLFFAHDWNTTAPGTRTPPASYTELVDHIVYAAERLPGVAGPTGSVAMTNANAAGQPWQTAQLGLRPSVVDVTVTMKVDVTSPPLILSLGTVGSGFITEVFVTGFTLLMDSVMGAVFVGGSGVAQPKPPDKEGRMLAMANWMGS